MRRRRRPDPRKTFEADMAERIASGDKEAVKRLEKIGPEFPALAAVAALRQAGSPSAQVRS
jgi:hypothetical protein